MFKIGNVIIENRVLVAPMAGITDMPFRIILKEFGSSLLTTELVSAKGIFYNNRGNSIIMATCEKEKPIALQLFGSDPIIMATVANKVKDPYDIIDINMGCPVSKVVNNGEGAALMKNIELAKRIVDTMVRVVKDRPITCKIRIGYDNNHINAVDFAKGLENAGCQMITVHGRTKTALYSGESNNDVIKEVKKAVKIPVIANGNIFTVEEAKRVIEYTCCDGIAIGRGIKGNPWFVRECIEYIENGKKIERPTVTEIKMMMKRHVDDMIAFKGEKIGISELRHHIAWYTKEMKNSSKFRLALNSVKTKDELYKLIDELN